MQVRNRAMEYSTHPTLPAHRSRWGYATIEKVWGYLFITPFLLLFLVFQVAPSAMAIWLSLVHWRPRDVTWVGLQNYQRILDQEAFWVSMKNTFLYVLMVVPIEMVLAFMTSVLIYSLRFEGVRQFFQAAFYLPGVVSGLAVAIVWRFMYDYQVGLANYFLGLLGLEPVNWLGNVNTALPSLAAMAILGGGGAAIIIFVAGLGGIPTEYYDAATIDGANMWHKLIAITLPLLMPAILYVLVVSTIGAFQVFIPVYVLTNGGPANSTLTVGYYIYRQVFYYSDLGVAAAAGLLLLLVTVGFTIIQFRRFSQVVEY